MSAPLEVPVTSRRWRATRLPLGDRERETVGAGFTAAAVRRPSRDTH